MGPAHSFIREIRISVVHPMATKHTYHIDLVGFKGVVYYVV